MPAPAPVQTATLNKFLSTWKEKDIDGTVALWSEDFTQRLLPSSLGVPTKSRSQAEMAYPNLMGSLANWNLEINEIVHDAARGTAAVYATSHADTPLPDEDWAMEYAVFLSFSEDGHKISRMEEMLDTSAFKHLFPKLQQYFMEQANKNSA